MTSRVTPHSAFVAQVSARRAELDFAAPLGALDARAVWSAVRERTVDGNRNYWIGRIKHDPQVMPALALLTAGALPEPFDPKAAAVAERIVPRGYGSDSIHTLVRLVAEARGVPEMVAVKLDSIAIRVAHNEDHVTFDGEEVPAHDSAWDVARADVDGVAADPHVAVAGQRDAVLDDARAVLHVERHQILVGKHSRAISNSG